MIINYEDETTSLKDILEKVNNISNSHIGQYIIENHWASEDLEEFGKRYTSNK